MRSASSIARRASRAPTASPIYPAGTFGWRTLIRTSVSSYFHASGPFAEARTSSQGIRERLGRRVIDLVALPRCLADYSTVYCWLTWYTVKLQVPAAVGSRLKVTWLAPVGIVMAWFVSGVVQFGSE
jgi:hypothetical protein